MPIALLCSDSGPPTTDETGEAWLVFAVAAPTTGTALSAIQASRQIIRSVTSLCLPHMISRCAAQ
eukprot:6204003-Pleurochrysis_carterae.AAC.9